MWKPSLIVLPRLSAKGYRESLEQNRDAVLLSKELVHHRPCRVIPLPLDLQAMETQEPRPGGLPHGSSANSSSTSMLRELAPSASAPALELIDEATEQQENGFYEAARKNGFAFALAAKEPTEEDPESDEQAVQQTMSLLEVVEEAEKERRNRALVSVPKISKGLCLPLTPELKALLEGCCGAKKVHPRSEARDACPLRTGCRPARQN